MSIYLVEAVILTALLAMLLWPVRHDKKQCALIAILFFLGGYGLYGWVGTPQILPMLAERDEKIATLKTTILADSAAVKADPKNLQAWVELGNSFMQTSQYAAASNAFKQAVILSGGNPQLILNYAKSMIVDDGGKVSDAAKKSLEMVVMQQPDNAEAQYFLILRQLQDGDAAHAMPAMKKLYHSLPEDSPLKALIDAQIGRTN